MAYTHLTRAGFRAELAARLHDTSMVTWVSDELDLYLDEALRTFSALSGFWRERGTFFAVAGTAYYDLPTELPTQLAYNVTNQDLLYEIEYHLLEPPTAAWTGTEQFTSNDILKAVQRRRNQFLMETGVRNDYREYIFVAVPFLGRYELEDDVIDVRRLGINEGYEGAPTSHLWRTDEMAATTYDQAWVTAATPLTYSVTAVPPLTVQLIPPPTAIYSLYTVVVRTGADISSPMVAVPIGIPDDLTWAVKWGALADLLSKDGPAKDPERSNLCEKRYQEGVEIAKFQTRILTARIIDTPMVLGSIGEFDAYSPGWDNATSALPTDILTSGLNLIALHPTPDDHYRIALDIVRNADIPATDATDIQLGREQVEAVLDYSEHLALFKHAGPEFEATGMYWDNLVRIAAKTMGRMSAAGQYLDAMANQSKREEYFRLRTVPELKQGEAANG